MTVRRRVISAIVVVGVGLLAALPFVKPPNEEPVPAASDVKLVTATPSPSVALRIPVDQASSITDRQSLDPSTSERSESQYGNAKEMLQQRDERLPRLASEFPNTSPTVPPASTIVDNRSDNLAKAAASPRELEEPIARTYRIRDGDTLRKLAQRYLKDPERWTEILAANRSVIQDPELLPIGKEITISPRGPVPPASAASPPATQEVAAEEPPLTPLVPIR